MSRSPVRETRRNESHVDRPLDSQIIAVLDAALEGRAGGMVITGGRGLGKTETLQTATVAALERGFKAGVAEDYAAAVPLLVATHLARGLGVHPALEQAELPAWIDHALRSIATAGKPVLLAFDSIDRYASADLAVVEDLLRVPPVQQLAVIATLGTGEAGLPLPPEHLRDFLDRLARRHVRVIDLPPFNVDETEDLTVRVLETMTAAPRFVRQLHALTRGDPSLMLPLLVALRRMGEAGERYLVGSRSMRTMPIPDVIVQRLTPTRTDFPEACLELLRAMAVRSSADRGELPTRRSSRRRRRGTASPQIRSLVGYRKSVPRRFQGSGSQRGRSTQR